MPNDFALGSTIIYDFLAKKSLEKGIEENCRTAFYTLDLGLFANIKKLSRILSFRKSIQDWVFLFTGPKKFFGIICKFHLIPTKYSGAQQILRGRQVWERGGMYNDTMVSPNSWMLFQMKFKNSFS